MKYTKKLKPGWYIILYHDVNWEENLFTKFIGGTCPPDIFFDHINLLGNLGDFVTIEEGLKKISKDEISKPLFSLWFDDGLKGVFNHALPITEKFNIKPAISICSNFINKKEMFWRFKISFLHGINRDIDMRNKLKLFDYKLPSLIKDFTTENFTPSLISHIDEIYNKITTESFRRDSFRIFIDQNELGILKNKKWTIGNHTANHYRFSKTYDTNALINSFRECELNCKLLEDSKYWVLPFGYPKNRDKLKLDSSCDENYIVFVNNKMNTNINFQKKSINRIDATINSAESLRKKLFNL